MLKKAVAILLVQSSTIGAVETLTPETGVAPAEAAPNVELTPF